MTFLNDLWKKVKAQPISEKPSKQKSTDNLDAKLDANTVLTAFQQNEVDALQSEKLANNLKVLRALLEEPKEAALESRFEKIEAHLGQPESHEILRQERWPHNIHCPTCQSTHLKRLIQLPPKSIHNHRYRCLDCGAEFSDDTDTPIEHGVPPINIWMQCWYLLGCTDSLAYIAHKLGLELGTVEAMVRQLKEIFQAQKPESRLLNEEEWGKQSRILRLRFKEDLLKQHERLNANVATAPKDTVEFRRQQTLRRSLSTEPKPPPATPTAPGRKR